MHDLDKLFDEVRQIVQGSEERPEASFLLELISTGLRFVGDRPDPGDMKMLSTAFKELRHGFKVFAPYRPVRKVSVFGSARTPSEDQAYKDAYSFSTAMTRRGWMVITGAGPGIMEAAQGGAGCGRSFGVNIRLPFEEANAVIRDDPKLVSFKHFFTRKVVFVKETDAIALFPGGFGTHDEAFESLTLVQTGKGQLLPVVFIDSPGRGYWKEWREYIEKHLRRAGYISPTDLDLFRCTESYEEAIEIIVGFYRNYHSSYYEFDRLVIRLRNRASDALLDRLNGEFADILTRGKIERLEAQPGDRNGGSGLEGMPRIGLCFDRRSIGRLRRMVDAINEDGERNRAGGGDDGRLRARRQTGAPEPPGSSRRRRVAE